VLAVGIEQRQLHGTAGGVAVAAAVVPFDRRRLKTLGHRQRLIEIVARLELLRQIAAL
jgi:hypothetical protein